MKTKIFAWVITAHVLPVLLIGLAVVLGKLCGYERAFGAALLLGFYAGTMFLGCLIIADEEERRQNKNQTSQG